MNTKLQINAVVTDDGKYYLSQGERNSLKSFLIDGETPKPSFHSEWVMVDKRPKRISKLKTMPRINHRYELIEKSLISAGIPEFLDRDKVAEWDEEEYEYIWNVEWNKYRSLYKTVSDEQTDIEEEYEFEIITIIKTKNIVDPVKMEYVFTRDRYKETVNENSVEYQLADRIIFPSILLPQRPCKLSSEETYGIVRKYIKDNIDPQRAEITSDYDFCFAVKRRIKLAKVLTYRIDTSSKRSRKPKYTVKYEDEKKEQCFEMTHGGKNYQGYTPIKGFQASSQKELKDKIDSYCKDLIDFINVELKECTHCDGNGYLIPKTKGN